MLTKESKPEEIRSEWIKSLRSGEYSQTTRFLHDKIGFCCLGVLCDLAVKAGIISPPTEERCFPEGIDDNSLCFSYDGDRNNLPESVQNWAGLSNNVGGHEEDSSCLARQNDNGSTFTEIADFIESNPKGLFI